MRRPVLFDMTAPYSAVEAFLYDRYLEPSVGLFVRDLSGPLLGPVPTGGEVLDVGCGGGQLAVRLLEERPDLRLTGMDLSPGQVGRARARTERFGGRADFVQGSALDIPFPSGRFDAVTSVASIKHWPDRARGLRECVRVLRPGGNLVIAEADRGCTLEDARRFARGFRLPRLVRPAVFVMFRVWVAGQAIDLDDARALARDLHLENVVVERIPGAPGLWIRGRAG